jgi:hypothetical protein
MNTIKTFKKFSLNESLNNLTFKTDVTNVDFYFLETNLDFLRKNNIVFETDSNHTIDDIIFTVFWELEIDSKEWGVKDLSVNIKSIIGRFVVNMWDKDTSYEVEFNPEQEGFKVSNKMEINSFITPTNIEIDFRSKNLTIN